MAEGRVVVNWREKSSSWNRRWSVYRFKLSLIDIDWVMLRNDSRMELNEGVLGMRRQCCS